MNLQGKRRLVAFLSALGVLGVVELVPQFAAGAGGLSAFGQGAFVALFAAYFGGDAVQKGARAVAEAKSGGQS